MSKYKFANNARAHLNEPSGITATQATFILDDSSVFPEPFTDDVLHLTLDDDTNKEIVKVLVNDVASNTLTITRGAEGTTKSAFGNATTISLRPTAEPFNKGLFSLDDNQSGALTGNYALDLITKRTYATEAASGSSSIALGDRPKAAASESIAIGTLAYVESTSTYGIAIGRGADVNAGCIYSMSIGAYSTCHDDYALAMGYGAYAGGLESIAIGDATVRSGSRGSIAIGENADTYNSNISYSISLGYSASGRASYAVAIGYSSQVSDYGGIAIGYNPTCGGQYAIAIGRNVITSGSLANIAIGDQAVASAGSYGMVIGAGLAKSTGDYSIAFGYGSDAGASNAIVIGNSAKSLAAYGIGVGYLADAAGAESIVLGREASATATNGIAIGSYAKAAAANTHNIAGLSAVKKDLGETGEVAHFCAQETIVMSKDITYLGVEDDLVEVTLPAGGQFFVNKVGVMVLQASGITVFPQITFGNITSPAALLAPTTLTGMVTGKGYEFDVLTKDSQATLTMSSKVFTEGTSYRVRVYFKGIFVED